MVQLRQEEDNRLILQMILLQLLHRLCNLDVVHLEAQELLVMVFLVLQLAHKDLLFLVEHLLASPVKERRVDLLGQGKDIVEWGVRDTCHLEAELVDRFLQFTVFALNLHKLFVIQSLDDRLGSEA